mgnify:CR=1 FL=1
MSRTIRRAASLTLVLVASTLALPSSVDARVKKIVVEEGAARFRKRVLRPSRHV